MDSAYLRNLLVQNAVVGERYRMKLALINGLDPFALNAKELDHSVLVVPPITNMDITTYLVLTHSYYTKDQMKAHKSLKAYKDFDAGFVTTMGTKIVNPFYILVAKVKQSQRTNLKLLDVWVIVSQDGSISDAHCTCMTANSAVCSHIAAVLFAAEYLNTKKETVDSKVVKPSWPMPELPNEAPVVPVREMNWGKSLANVEQANEIPSVSHAEIVDVIHKIRSLGSDCVIVRIVEPFASEIANQRAKTDLVNNKNINSNTKFR